MTSLIYSSSATIPFSKEALTGLLKQSRENNTGLGITGLLLYKDGKFMQVIEGEEDVVRKLFSTISKDPRNSDVSELRWETVGKRRFPNWSMGFENLDDAEISHLPGYSEFMNDSLTSPDYKTDSSRVQRLLQIFKQNA